MNNVIQKAIKAAIKKKSRDLGLSAFGLEELPQELIKLPELVELRLDFNQWLIDISSVRHLQNLTKLSLYKTGRMFNKLCQVKNGFYKNTDYGKREAKVRF